MSALESLPLIPLLTAAEVRKELWLDRVQTASTGILQAGLHTLYAEIIRLKTGSQPSSRTDALIYYLVSAALGGISGAITNRLFSDIKDRKIRTLAALGSSTFPLIFPGCFGMAFKDTGGLSTNYAYWIFPSTGTVLFAGLGICYELGLCHPKVTYALPVEPKSFPPHQEI